MLFYMHHNYSFIGRIMTTCILGQNWCWYINIYGVGLGQIDLQAIVSEFKSDCVQHTFGLVPQQN